MKELFVSSELHLNVQCLLVTKVHIPGKGCLQPLAVIDHLHCIM